MSSFNVADNKSEFNAATAFNVDDMSAALGDIDGTDVSVSIKMEPGMTLNITRVEETNAPKDDDDEGDQSVIKAPVVPTSHWSPFYNAGTIAPIELLAALPALFQFIKAGVYRNKKTGMLVHDGWTVLSVQIGTLRDSKFQTGGFTYGKMVVRDARIHLPFMKTEYSLVSLVNVIRPLVESKGTTHTDGTRLSSRLRLEDAGSKEDVAKRMCSHVQRVAVYAPTTRGPNGESASQAICFEFNALVTSHYLEAEQALKILQHGLLAWDIAVKSTVDGSISRITVCGIAGLLEVMALSNIRATYGLSPPNKTTTKTRSYYTSDNLTGGIFGLLYNYLVQGIFEREASLTSAGNTAASSDVNRVAEAEVKAADANRRALESDSRVRGLEEQLSLQAARANANAAEVVLLKKKNAELARTIQTLVVSGRAAEEALKRRTSGMPKSLLRCRN